MNIGILWLIGFVVLTVVLFGAALFWYTKNPKK